MTATSKGKRRTGAPQGAPSAPAFSPKDLLLGYQRRWVDDKARFKIACMSRQTGKSFCTAAEAVEDALLDPGTTWVCLSAGERQALEWLEKAKDWAEAYRLAIEKMAEDRDFAEALLKSAEIRFANGSRILAIPANPNTARGYSANVILDEFAYHEDPDKIWGAMFPSVTNPLAGTFMQRVNAAAAGEAVDAIRRIMRVRVVSTFNGRNNKFFDLWEKAEGNGYSKHLVTIHDALKDGLPVDIEQLKSGLDDPELWAQEYECVPMDTSNVLLPYDLIALAESADATEATDLFAGEISRGLAGRTFYCGIDFGRQNDPTVCVLLERVADLLWTREIMVLKGVDTPDQQALLRERLRLARRSSFDYTGPGVGLGDFLAREFGPWDPKAHEFGKIDLCTFSVGFKREIFPRLRRQFEAPTKLRVPISRKVREDLHAMQQLVHNGQYDYWAPRTRDGHSDICTAYALAVRAADFDAGGDCGVAFV